MANTVAIHSLSEEDYQRLMRGEAVIVGMNHDGYDFAIQLDPPVRNLVAEPERRLNAAVEAMAAYMRFRGEGFWINSSEDARAAWCRSEARRRIEQAACGQTP